MLLYSTLLIKKTYFCFASFKNKFMHILHLRNKDIDFEKWDKNISESINYLSYALSWYLDIVSPGWEALVSDDYDYLMPIPVKRKFNIPYIVQPLLTQQLGIFSKNTIDENIVQDFIYKIPYYSYELNLNDKNIYLQKTELPNYVLNLNQKYNLIKSTYSKNTNRNISKAQQSDLILKNNLSPDEFIEFYSNIEKKYLSAQDYMLEKIIAKAKEMNLLTIYGAYNQNNKLVAALCLLHSGKRLTYLIPASNEVGKKLSAMFLIIDSIIKTFCENDNILDFEGSKIEGIARFYKGFGAVNQPYFILKRFRPDFLVGKFKTTS